MSAQTYVTVDCSVHTKIFQPSADFIPMLHSLAQATLYFTGLCGWYSLCVAFDGNKAVQRANRQFRGVDAPTDTLSFPAADSPLIALPPELAWAPREWGDDTHDAPMTYRHTENANTVAFSKAYPLQSHGSAQQPLYLGDILMSAPTLFAQAKESGHSELFEIAFLFTHSVLHLIGFDDFSEMGYNTMVHIQRAILAAENIQE